MRKPDRRSGERVTCAGRLPWRALGAAGLICCCGCVRSDAEPTPAPGAVTAAAEPGSTAPVIDKDRWFVEITDEVGLRFVHDAAVEGYRFEEATPPGCALFDYDGDGRLDLYLINGGAAHRDPAAAPVTDRLFRQQSDGTFADVTEEAGVRESAYGMGCANGDYDNDGDQDLYVTNLGPDRLLRNNGDGTFSDVTDAAGIRNDLWAVSAAFFDYDRDGLLDLFVSNYVLDSGSARCYDNSGRPDYCGPESFPPSPDKLFHNEGGGRFRDVSVESGIASAPGPGLGVVCADFNRDGWDDVYVANDGAANFLWINRHDGTFEETAVVAGCAFNRDGDAEAGMGIAVGDADRDGWLDIFVTNLWNETNTFYHATGGGYFADETDMRGLGMSSFNFTAFGTCFGDMDHDGDEDLMVANGAVKRRPWPSANVEAAEYWRLYAEQNLFYLNDGAGRFENVSADVGPICTRAEVSRALVFGDLDNDGDLDVVITNDGGPVRIFRNDVPKVGRWLIVRARDPALRRDALGAFVTVAAGGQTFQRTIVATAGYAAGREPVAHFGLGPVTRIEHVTVRWPDGSMERFDEVTLDAEVVLMRGTGTAAGVRPP